MQPADIYTGTSGLATKVDPYTLPYNPAAIPLVECSNVDVTDAGKVRLRGGLSDVWLASSLGAFHSPHSTYHYMAFVEDGALTIVDKNQTITRLADVRIGAYMSFAEDIAGRLFFSNGIQNGFILGNQAYNWVNTTERVGPATTKEYGPPPIGHLLGIFGGYMLVAYENFIFVSEPFNSFSFNRGEGNIPLDSPARMMKEVTGGLWVSTGTKLIFFAGRDIRDLHPVVMYDKPAVRGTAVAVPADKLNPEATGIGVMVTAEDAILYLTPDGQVSNLSEGKIDIPPGATGSAAFHEGQYIVQINTL